MARREKRKLSSEGKLKILCERWLEQKPISEVCDRHEISPAQFYTWQKSVLERAVPLLDRKRSSHNENAQLERMRGEMEALRQEVQQKNSTLADLMQEHVQLKKTSSGAT
jgi:transposase